MNFFHQFKQHGFRVLLGSLGVLLATGVGFAASKPLLVYYMPWYVAKPYSDNWGWHWTMNHFNPDVTDASGEKQIASWYHPLIGPYDSADPVVLEYHVLLMKLAGIDGVIVDWYGRESHLDYGINNERTAALFKLTRKAGLKFALCYEDRTVLQQINDGVLAATNAIRHAQQTMLYVQSNYFGDPSYLQLSNRPVLLNFGPQFFKANEQWEQIFSVLEATNRPAFFTEDNRLPLGMGAFNWPPMWLSLAPGARGVLSVTALENYLANFEQNGSGWPAFISSAFPRFHDIYQPAGVRDYWGYLGDRKGEVLRMTLSRALTNNSALAQIVTWNDFGEGTVVEPTTEYGYRDLGIIQDARRAYLDSRFPLRTNDLGLAMRLYQLRRTGPADAKTLAELDQIFAEIVALDLVTAERRLNQLESQTTQPRPPKQ
ncbi:MAG: hypothetical protein HOP33_01355 [Verrucomicrobia bacterium]|nr:hypothetical protein [Verrucomicrobiota bacterium]